MKNIAAAVFMLVVCVAGTVIAAALYFVVTFGALGWLFEAPASRLGEAIGSATTALGFPVGGAMFGLVFWDRLVRDDGRPDLVARTVAIIIGAPLALAPLVLAGPMALASVAHFKAFGFLAVAGFLGLGGLVERMTRKRI